jgi:hypothetical protein
LQSTNGVKPPAPRENTNKCDGNGNIVPQIGFPETLGGPKEQACLMDCALVHEASHRDDLMAADPKICQGVRPGWLPAFTHSGLKASEVKAANAEIDCLRSKLEKGGCKGCGPIILNRITEVQGVRNWYKNVY